MSRTYQWRNSGECTKQKKESKRIPEEKTEDGEEIRQKVDELCKRYVPILPASNPADPTVCLYAVQEFSDNRMFLPNNGYSPFVLQYSDFAEQKSISDSVVTNVIDTIDLFAKDTDTIFLLCDERNEIDCSAESHDVDGAAKCTMDIASKIDAGLHKHRRKSRVRIEEPDDLVFTDNLEDLLEKSDLESNRKRRRTFANHSA